ncbi:helix-turn-helix domain-containing protein [Streptomyces abyssomicinicus]|uniref:helix-turn-helix domain-containing protein n=1 Tax=Streptomyces abyssomicinicus TaxID=574929 RepID=UPI00124FE52A|nr:helix-turn-helix transcriptional regulator [Streptomyces abyssomicinicus]
MRDDVEEFAALLRRLKDRTDRSYGSLARRVDMNTSTLHRYCRGEAVPQEFAPVERLAGFCEATPEERLELHRLWLSAVAARQGVRPADSATAAATAAPAPAPDGARVEESGSAEQPGGDPAPDGSVPSTAPRVWYRRRRVLASTAVACALLATPAIRSALPDDRSSETDAARSAGVGTTAPGARDPAAKPATGLPLAWSVDSLVWDKGCDHDYVIDKPPAQVPSPPVEQDAGTWAATQGAVHGRRTKVQISVQGRSSTAVVLKALHVRVVSRSTPGGGGNAYAMGQGCGGDLTPRRFTVNLDADRPVTSPTDGSDIERTVPAVHFPYRVSDEDPEVLLVDATTQTYDARWYLELDWSSQGRTGTIRIDDHGRPFHTTSIEGLPHYWHGTNDAGERAWVPYDS